MRRAVCPILLFLVLCGFGFTLNNGSLKGRVLDSEGKPLANVKVYICGLAGKIWGGEKLEDFVDLADDIVGIGECITSMEESDIHLFI